MLNFRARTKREIKWNRWSRQNPISMKLFIIKAINKGHAREIKGSDVILITIDWI